VNHLLLALGAMFVQQTFASIARSLPAVIAPAIIADLLLDPAWIGIYFGVTASAALVVQMGCGGFIVRYGALRMSQASLGMLVLGNGLATLGTPLALVLSAISSGAGSALSTPSSSHLLGRCTTPKYLPLVFSIKQTAVPAGMLMCGVLGPQLTQWIDWRGTMLASAGACAVFVLMLQPLRRIFDDDRMPGHVIALSDLRETFSLVLDTQRLRSLSFACLAFNGLQTVMTAYFVVYLTTIGYSPVAAGFVFSAAVMVAVPGRIVWGWLGSGHIRLRPLMAALAFGMAAGFALLGLSSAGWSTWLVGAIAGVISGTALSWHGILLSEAARAAPEGKRGAVTGGVLSFGQMGGLAEPLVFSALLGLTGSYGAGFMVCAIPALLVGIALLRQDPVAETDQPHRP
jgi:MFS family permease